MKIFLLATIVVFCGTCGIIYANKYRKNYIFYADLLYIFNIFKLKIAFFQNNIAVAMEESLLHIKSKTNFFNGVILIAKKSKLTEDNIISCIDINLPIEEKQLIARYFLGIAFSYETSVVENYILNGQKYFENRQNYYQTKDNQEGTLAKKISIGIGLVIAILLY